MNFYYFVACCYDAVANFDDHCVVTGCYTRVKTNLQGLYEITKLLLLVMDINGTSRSLRVDQFAVHRGRITWASRTVLNSVNLRWSGPSRDASGIPRVGSRIAYAFERLAISFLCLHAGYTAIVANPNVPR